MEVSTLAAQKLESLLAIEANRDSKLRIFIEGGGCSGFKYGFALDKQQDSEDILIGSTVVVDCMSMPYLKGATLDYRETLQESGFLIVNPQAKTTCGCGASFSLE